MWLSFLGMTEHVLIHSQLTHWYPFLTNKKRVDLRAVLFIFFFCFLFLFGGVMGGRVSKGLPASVINDFDWSFRAILGSTMVMFKGLRSTKFIHNFVASTISDAFFLLPGSCLWRVWHWRFQITLFKTLVHYFNTRSVTVRLQKNLK